MNINKANQRDKERNKRRYGMRVTGASVKVIQQVLIKKGKPKKGKVKNG